MSAWNVNGHATYEIVYERPDLKIVWLVDDGPHSQHKTVTNDAEFVCERVNSGYPGYRIIYRATTGRWDELAHERGEFLRFIPGGPHMGPRNFQ